MTIPQRYGITFPFDGIPLLEQRELVRELVDLGYTDLWSAESGGYDAFIPLAVAAQWAPELRLGTAIVPVYTRGAHTLASTVASMCQAAPGRFALGIGTSSDVIVERWNGIAVRQAVPARARHDPLPARRAHGREGRRGVRDVPGARVPARHHRCPSSRRSSSPRCARACCGSPGREGDGAIINWLSADDVKTVAPHVGADKEIAARIFVFPVDDAGLARSVGKRAIASYLTVPVYAAFHEWLGPRRRARRTCGGSGRKATARPRRSRSPTPSSTTCSCGARPSSARSTSRATWRTASPLPRPRCSAAPTSCAVVDPAERHSTPRATLPQLDRRTAPVRQQLKVRRRS